MKKDLFKTNIQIKAEKILQHINISFWIVLNMKNVQHNMKIKFHLSFSTLNAFCVKFWRGEKSEAVKRPCGPFKKIGNPTEKIQ